MLQLTKHEHACFVVEKNGMSLIVDPGGLTEDLTVPTNVVAVVYTHNHEDHLEESRLKAIVAANPDVLIIGPQDVTKSQSRYTTKTVTDKEHVEVAGFNLEFFGRDHAVIHPDLPRPHNIGVMIDELVYYPGDSFTVPSKPVDTLALPVGAPWLKIEEAIDFLKSVHPRAAFPTHDAVLSATGQHINDSMMSVVAKEAGIDYERIDGQTITIG